MSTLKPVKYTFGFLLATGTTLGGVYIAAQDPRVKRWIVDNVPQGQTLLDQLNRTGEQIKHLDVKELSMLLTIMP